MATFNAGSEVSAADLNSTVPSICHCVAQTAQTGWTTQTPTAITFGTGSTVVDTDAIHSESSNTSRFVIGKRLGWWEVSGVYAAASSTTAAAFLRAILYKNGSAIFGSFNGVQGAANVFIGLTTPTIQVEATASTDYIELYGYESQTGTPIGTAVSSPYVASSIRLRWVRSS